MNLKKAIPSFLASAAVLLAMAFFLASPARYVKSVSEGISLWAVSVLPATFPFLFLTAIFTRLKLYGRLSRAAAPIAGKAFRVSGAGGCAAVLSMLSGYPVGARTVLDLYEKGAVSKQETFRLACLCSTTGPMFLVGVVGSAMFQNVLLGWVLLLSHYFGVLTVCFFLRFTGKPFKAEKLPVIKTRNDNIVSESLTSSVLSVLCVGGSIAVFYAFGQMLSDVGAFIHMGNTAEGILRGLLEMTSGCALLSQAPAPLTAALSCFLVTFGGLCVLVQQIAFLSRAEVKTLPFLGVKLLQAVIAGGAAYLLSLAVF
ncbi:MAG: hypothetical protein K2G44_05965 [Clostridia bacterium]|nr:hypothetical protein [Clostridia bacterium]